MIRFGPAGIPLSCKGRTLKDGIEDVHNLGLTALEIQLVRVNTTERFPMPEEVGKVPFNTENDLIVEIRKGGGKGPMASGKALKKKLAQNDLLTVLVCGVAKSYPQLRELGRVAKDLDIQLSIHTPYYMHLTDTADNPLTAHNLSSIRWAGILADQIGATVITTHLGIYTGSKKESLENVRKNVRSITKWFKDNGIKVSLGLETNGKQEVFGSLQEILDACKGIPGAIPVVNFPHVHAREGGSLIEKPDFDKLLSSVIKATRSKSLYTHFSGVEYEGKNEKRYTPIKKGDLKFEPLAEAIIDAGIDITVVSSSPLMEHDAMYMKVILERVLTRTESKRKKKDKNERK